MRISRRLGTFESLESRALFAVAAFEILLLADVQGHPGAPVATITAGDTFFAEVTAQEFDPALHGLSGVALNASWNPAVLAEIDEDMLGTITADLPAFRTGTLEKAAGTLEDLGGSAFGAGHPIGDGQADHFAWLHFKAIAPGSTAIELSEGRSQIVALPTATFRAEQFAFDRQAVDVVLGQAMALPSVRFLDTLDMGAFGQLNVGIARAHAASPAAASTPFALIAQGLEVERLAQRRGA